MRALAEELKRALCAPVIEPRSRGAQLSSRPGIVALGERGTHDALDVAVVHTFCYAARVRSAPDVCLRKMETAKRTRLEAYAATTGTTVRPIIFSANGGWLPESHAYAQGVACDIVTHTGEPVSVARVFLFQRIAAVLIAGSARALLAGTHIALY